MLGKAKKKRQKISSGKNNKLKPALIALGLVICIVFLGRFIAFLHGLDEPYSPDGESIASKNYVWDGTSTFSIVIKAEALYVLVLDPGEKSLKLIKIPDTTYLKLPFSFGRWKAQSIYALGQAEKPAIGAKLLKETISNNLGLPLDGYLLIPENLYSTSFDKVLEQDHSSLGMFVTIIKHSKTDLSFSEMFRFFRSISGVRFDKIRILDLTSSNLTNWEVLADGSRVLSLDQLQLDQYIQSQFEDKKISFESVNVGIFNATNHPQMAERASRVITNLGGRVIFTSNLNDHLEKSLVLGKDSYTKTRLASIFAPNCLEKKPLIPILKTQDKCHLDNNKEGFSRADINIILGEDYFLNYNRSSK